MLFTTASADAVALEPFRYDDGSKDRAVAVIGREGEFWAIETLPESTQAELGVLGIEGLGLYRLRLFVPIDVGEAFEPLAPAPIPVPPPAVNEPEPEPPPPPGMGILDLLPDTTPSHPPLQSGTPRKPDCGVEWRVSPSTHVYWWDGTEAGDALGEHAFCSRSRSDVLPSLVGELSCFSAVIGPLDRPDYAQLCFRSADLHETRARLDFGASFAEAHADTAPDDDIFPKPKAAYDYDYRRRGLDGWTVDREPFLYLSVQQPTVTGAMDAKIAHRFVDEHWDEVDDCWDDEAGSSRLSLVVDRKGHVTSSRAKGPRPAIARCIEAASARWKFPSASEGTIAVIFDFAYSDP